MCKVTNWSSYDNKKTESKSNKVSNRIQTVKCKLSFSFRVCFISFIIFYFIDGNILKGIYIWSINMNQIISKTSRLHVYPFTLEHTSK